MNRAPHRPPRRQNRRPVWLASLLATTLLAGPLTAPVRGAAPNPAPDPAPRPREVDPDTLVVPAPPPPPVRKPSEAISRLLRPDEDVLHHAETLDIRIAQREDELKRLHHQLDVVSRDLETTTRRFHEETRRLADARRHTRQRLRALTQLRRVSPYSLLFSAKDFQDAEHRQRLLKALVEGDRRRVAAYRSDAQAWRDHKADLERRRTNLQHTEAQIRFALQQLELDRQEKDALVAAVRDKPSYNQKVMRELHEVDRALVDKVDRLRDRDRRRLWFEESKGRLIRNPINKGVIIARFGKRKHKRLGTETFNPGVDIVPSQWDGEEEVPVHAIYSGTVVWTGWQRGLGNTVILDHTRGYMSLYGHLARVDVKVGQVVKGGDTLGLMGDTGSLWGKRLHLEIRLDGKALDPRPWLR